MNIGKKIGLRPQTFADLEAISAPDVKQVMRNGKWVSVKDNNDKIFATGVQPPTPLDHTKFW